MSTLAGCIYTETDLDFRHDASLNLIAEGYWKACGIFAGKLEECHILKPLIISYFVDLRRGIRYNIEMFNSRYDHDTSSKLSPICYSLKTDIDEILSKFGSKFIFGF